VIAGGGGKGRILGFFLVAAGVAAGGSEMGAGSRVAPTLGPHAEPKPAGDGWLVGDLRGSEVRGELRGARPGADDGGESGASDTIRIMPGEALQPVVDAAPEGSHLLLETGLHRGPVRVSRALVLEGEAGARIEGRGRGSVVVLEGEGAEVRRLEITGSGRDLGRDDAGVLVTGDGARIRALRLRDNLHGVYVRGGEDVRVEASEITGPGGAGALEGNGIHLWAANGAVVSGNRIRGVRDGIYVAHVRDALFDDNRVRDSRFGIHYMYSSENVLVGNELSGNVVGAALMFSRRLRVEGNRIHDHRGARGYGILLQDVEDSEVTRNALEGNGIGIRLQNSSGNALEGNRVAGNRTGLRIGSASRENRFSTNRIGPNLRDVELTGSPPPTRWSVEGVGNRWWGSLPLDLDGDGVSEWPHHEVDVLGGARARFPAARLLAGSPGLSLLEWALSRAPLPGGRHVTDPDPLTGTLGPGSRDLGSGGATRTTRGADRPRRHHP